MVRSQTKPSREENMLAVRSPVKLSREMNMLAGIERVVTYRLVLSGAITNREMEENKELQQRMC